MNEDKYGIEGLNAFYLACLLLASQKSDFTSHLVIASMLSSWSSGYSGQWGVFHRWRLRYWSHF